MRTHYGNLQVVETACLEVIKGAYRHLSQKWHTDKNPNNPDLAEKNMQIINEAYRVLSDPEKRREHDNWIREQRKQEIPPIPKPLSDISPNIEANDDDTVGSIRKTIESMFGLPEDSVALCDRTGRGLRADAKIKTLRSRWCL
jgi:DnaJ-class molecular chaperone